MNWAAFFGAFGFFAVCLDIGMRATYIPASGVIIALFLCVVAGVMSGIYFRKRR